MKHVGRHIITIFEIVQSKKCEKGSAHSFNNLLYGVEHYEIKCQVWLHVLVVKYD